MTEASPSTAPASGLDRATIGSGAATARPRPQLNLRAIITGVIFLAIIGLAIGYLARSEPLLVQGEAESTRIDMAARVSRRREKIAVARGPASATLVVIDNLGPVAERDRGKRRIRWLARATPATGDFGLHTFAFRAHPVERSAGRPGMRVYIKKGSVQRGSIRWTIRLGVSRSSC